MRARPHGRRKEAEVRRTRGRKDRGYEAKAQKRKSSPGEKSDGSEYAWEPKRDGGRERTR